MTTESRELALDDREFELFVRGCRNLDCELKRQEATFIAFVLGRLGLRSGELCHLHRDWIDWRRRMIEIPAQWDCTKGKHGGICGSCRQAAKQKVEYAAMSLEEARLAVLQDALGNQLPGHVRSQIRTVNFAAAHGQLTEDAMERQLEQTLQSADVVGDRDELLAALDSAARTHINEETVTYETAAGEMWKPKTSNAARRVPFDHDARAEIVVEEFFDRFDQWPESQSTINRRVDEVLRAVPEFTVETTTPHGLRATAATHIASRGLEALPMQAMFGWSSISTARNYVANSPENTQRQLHQIYSR